MVRLTDRLDMTIAVDSDINVKQSNSKLFLIVNLELRLVL